MCCCTLCSTTNEQSCSRQIDTSPGGYRCVPRPEAGGPRRGEPAGMPAARWTAQTLRCWCRKLATWTICCSSGPPTKCWQADPSWQGSSRCRTLLRPLQRATNNNHHHHHHHTKSKQLLRPLKPARGLACPAHFLRERKEKKEAGKKTARQSRGAHNNLTNEKPKNKKTKNQKQKSKAPTRAVASFDKSTAPSPVTADSTLQPVPTIAETHPPADTHRHTEAGRQTDRQTDRQMERERREGDRQTQSEGERERERHTPDTRTVTNSSV